VGEEVNIGFQPDLAEPQQWVCFDGSVDTNAGWNGHGVKFTAPSNEVGTVVCVWVHNQLLYANFTVWEPKGVDHAVITGTDHLGDGSPDNPPDHYDQGSVGAEMQLNTFIAPTSVSFYRVQLLEVGEEASVTGYFTNTKLFTTDPAYYFRHIPNTNWTSVGFDNSWPDTCWSQPNLFPSPWAAGSYTWVVPVKWSLSPTTVTNSMTSWSQAFSIDSSGTMTITKYGK
jgi:hypothetical protein